MRGSTYDARSVEFPVVGVDGLVVGAGVVVRLVGDGACRTGNHLNDVVASRKGSVGLGV